MVTSDHVETLRHNLRCRFIRVLCSYYWINTTIPFNTTATVYVPAVSARNVTEKGRAGVKYLGKKGTPKRDDKPAYVALERMNDGSYLVDWEVSSGYQEMPLSEFCAQKTQSPKEFRFTVELTDYYNFVQRWHVKIVAFDAIFQETFATQYMFLDLLVSQFVTLVMSSALLWCRGHTVDSGPSDWGAL